ncbi:3-phosphoserine aminotransferase [Komagataella phaffii CBS 7435]|uniref:phosphoserine transaminase n=2 Tax=Komagataella phaffii TaxID=460519 RepID=C4R4X8_KOMPG|nr:3-phosphoserine aminotransferase [Komagataella phaffii GS115]AOA63617.1 GQ67_03641T0 [Komagataella phaffii]CAH2449619.1 3-phosphoserine aminotransferase [Komagataella phaffii CBS 7435]AOA68952.1 GQ68_03613T0 [Komagataella phaffii GS115]CAY70614.1 3-phosphoserine aminotransferase [Komagataella phaffii GS115]CCA39597.2 3-phosphoserine aminotransferase [Komagataella phaffii CBS 7435]
MAKTLEREEPHYFGAGPALLPTSVLQEAAYDLVNYQGVGIGIGEISHRSKQASEVIDNTKANLVSLLNIPDTHEVFFLQGGGTTGFSSIASNLTASFVKKTGRKGRAAYAITGTWSKKSVEEAQRLGLDVDIVLDSKKVDGKFGSIPPVDKWSIPTDLSNTSYVYYCDNETVNGVEFKEFPFESFPGVEVVADMSSNILSKRLDVSKYGLIMAGAQKNIGLAGITIYIIKKSLLEQADDATLKALEVPLSPIAVHYPTVVKNNSAYNTIPIFAVHVVNLVLRLLVKNGGVDAQQKINEEKASILYGALEKFPQVYELPASTDARSHMNVVFTLNGDLDAEFLAQAAERKLNGLKGHRSVGGMRASIYNAVSLHSVQELTKFIIEFAEAHS